MFLTMSDNAIRARQRYAIQQLSTYDEKTPLLVIKKRISRLRKSIIRQEQLEMVLFSQSTHCLVTMVEDT